MRALIATAALLAFSLTTLQALAQTADEERAREAAAIITRDGTVEQYCGQDDSPALPGFTDAETEAACDIIANADED
ncbi:hypothetical protein ABEG18_06680 [Alsobacter sp. KACC 23698]|uniref:Uncharacterized protein n=1 Tax=Alsobacter sp. KACC 23698 TaxID=3149229 RepID=A0AAU7JJS4_9HYPH